VLDRLAHRHMLADQQLPAGNDLLNVLSIFAQRIE
jgi:hypothetical protein